MTQTRLREPLRIASRASGLALWQANHVASLLAHASPGLETVLVEVSTQGDRDRSGSLAQMGGQGVFTREVQQALLDGRADLAVHSLKDLPTEPVAGLQLAGIPLRAPRFDVMILPRGKMLSDWDDLPEQATVGTGSPRRRAQLLHHRPDLHFTDVRGNVETRLRKLDEGTCQALILAEAGLRRLDLASRISFPLAPPVMFPAVGQAALGIECRSGDAELIALLKGITDPYTHAEVLAERACLAALRAGCHAPVGVLSDIAGTVLSLTAVVLSADGQQRYEVRASGPLDDPGAVGVAAAEKLLAQGAGSLLA